MTDVQFTDEELSLIKRVLGFAIGERAVTDDLGNKIYPTEKARKIAHDLDSRLEAAGVVTEAGLYSTYDPLTLQDKKITARWEDSSGNEITIVGTVFAVDHDEETGVWTLTFNGGLPVQYPSRDDVKRNTYADLKDLL